MEARYTAAETKREDDYKRELKSGAATATSTTATTSTITATAQPLLHLHLHLQAPEGVVGGGRAPAPRAVGRRQDEGDQEQTVRGLEPDIQRLRANAEAQRLEAQIRRRRGGGGGEAGAVAAGLRG